MKIVIDLMRNIFIVMFFSLVALEIIVLISLTTLYRIPLDSNQKHIEEASMNNTKEVLKSFNNILQRKYYNLESDLLLIAKHLFPMRLTEFLIPSGNSNYLSFSKTSKFYRSYKDCLLDGDDFNTTSYVKDLKDSDSGITLMKRVFNNFNKFENFDEEKIINTMFEEERLNKIIHWPGIFIDEFDYIEKYTCYAISIFKSILIRNTIFEKSNLITDSFYLFLNKRHIFRYPIEYLDKYTYMNINYFDTSKTSCYNNYETYRDCYTSLYAFDTEQFNIQDNVGSILFDPPIRKSGGLFSRGCIHVPYDDTHTSYSCIDINMSNILKDVSQNSMNFFLINYDEKLKDFVFFYSSSFNNNQINIDKYKAKNFTLDKYDLDSNSNKFILFHAIYDNIFDYQSLTQDVVDDILEEYKYTVETLKNLYDEYEKDKNECNDYYKIPQSISNTTHYMFSTQFINRNESKIIVINKIFKAQQFIQKDKFQLVLFPVKLNSTKFHIGNYTFKTDCSANILYYSLVMVRVGTEGIKSNIYTILIFKSIRSFFFFISVLLFSNMVYFILSELYVKYLIYPIKYIHQKLEKLIKEKFSNETEELVLKERESIDNRDNFESKESNELSLYRNLETQKLEDLLNFLKKIVIMKQAHGHTDYKVKSKIYAKFLSDAFDQKYYRQCLFIIAYSKYKDQAFSDAYHSLNLLKKFTSQEEADLLSKNDNLEQKIINLPSLLQNNSFTYLNEFTDNDTLNDQELNKLIKLRIFSQKIYYLNGLIKYLDFCKRKQDLKAKNVPKPERIKKRREDHRLLEEAIADLNNALNINTTMNLNQIKCIFILILIAKCNFYNEKYTEASNDLKKALLKFSDLNKYFFEKNLWEQIDPRVMFIINGLIIEQILFNLGRVCEKLKKKQLSGWIFNKMMEISYFRTNEIYRKACGKLYKYFEVEKENLQFSNCKSLLSKITRRLKRYGSNKKICILVSENLLKYFNSSYELREVLLRCVDKYISEFDLVSFMQFDLSIQCYVAEAAKVYNSKIFRETENFCKYSGNIDEDQRIKTNFYRAMNSAISILINGETNTLESTEDSNDKYIFSFLFAEDFRFGSNDENKAILNGLIKNKISLYNFFFDDQIQESKLLKIKKYLKDVVEGFVIRVKNFKIIKQAFQNISNKGIQKNILNSTFENHKYIL